MILKTGRLKQLMILLAVIIAASVAHAEKPLIQLEKAHTDITDPASLQRGAQLFINNCLGCHGIKYERYKGLAKGIGITDEAGNVLENIVKQNLLFTGDKVTDQIDTAMQAADAEKWFGMAPPDLSLVARVRGKNWLYTYLKSFYKDPERPWGVNNLVFPDVAMPHVLLSLQGTQVVKYADTSAGAAKQERAIIGLELAERGSMTVAEYDQAVTDLVNFLSYVAEPVQVKRKHTGVLVLVFLGVFLVFSYLLKREYWKDIK